MTNPPYEIDAEDFIAVGAGPTHRTRTAGIRERACERRTPVERGAGLEVGDRFEPVDEHGISLGFKLEITDQGPIFSARPAPTTTDGSAADSVLRGTPRRSGVRGALEPGEIDEWEWQVDFLELAAREALAKRAAAVDLVAASARQAIHQVIDMRQHWAESPQVSSEELAFEVLGAIAIGAMTGVGVSLVVAAGARVLGSAARLSALRQERLWMKYEKRMSEAKWRAPKDIDRAHDRAYRADALTESLEPDRVKKGVKQINDAVKAVAGGQGVEKLAQEGAKAAAKGAPKLGIRQGERPAFLSPSASLLQSVEGYQDGRQAELREDAMRLELLARRAQRALLRIRLADATADLTPAEDLREYAAAILEQAPPSLTADELDKARQQCALHFEFTLWAILYDWEVSYKRVESPNPTTPGLSSSATLPVESNRPGDQVLDYLLTQFTPITGLTSGSDPGELRAKLKSYRDQFQKDAKDVITTWILDGQLAAASASAESGEEPPASPTESTP